MNELNKLKILVVGDIMLDKYVIGNIERISPEAPVPVVDVTKEYYTLGGCGNVARNLSKLGVETYCVGAAGLDGNKDILMQTLRLSNIHAHITQIKKRPTTVKERIIAKDRSTQLLRIDREDRSQISHEKIISEIRHIMISNCVTPDIILVSDYNKGVVTRELMKELEQISYKSDIKLIIDPKPANYNIYEKAWAITPNEKEFGSMTLRQYDFFDNVIVTLGAKGVKIVKSYNCDKTCRIAGEPVDVFNVTGAGDSFVAVFSTCAALGMDVINSSRIANKCAAYAVTKPGTSSVPLEIFNKAVKSLFPEGEGIWLS